LSFAHAITHARPFFVRRFCTAVLAGAILFCPSLFAQEQQPLSFAAIGDGPYAPEEWPLLAEQIVTESNNPDSAFVVHLGDITHGTDVLPEWYYIGVAGLLKISQKPVYVVIGDNEWNDLNDPATGWRLWRKHFEGFHRNFEGTRDTITQPAQPDNFAFVRNGVLIIGLNIVGGRIHDPAEWARRHANDLAWVNECLDIYGDDVRAMVVCAQANPGDPEKHGDFFDPFAERVAVFGKPVLYLHGDGHNYEHQSPWRVPNLVRVQIDSIGKNPPLLVTVTTNPDEPFLFDRRLPAVSARPSKDTSSDTASALHTSGAGSGKHPARPFELRRGIH
jgi:hypothetical protein